MLFFFLLAPAQALSASRAGLMLWFEQLLPTLLPFSVLSYVILHSGVFRMKANDRRIGAGEWYVICCGFLFGFPIGSKLTADLYREGQLSRKKASVLFVFTNNLSPVFVTSVFHEQLGRAPGAPTLLLLYGLPFVLCLLCLLRQKEREASHAAGHKNTASTFDLNMQIVDAGIINGFETLIKICGYIMMFSLAAELLSMLPSVSPGLRTLLIGATEVTNGMSALSGAPFDADTKHLMAMLFLSWGGLSGLFQTASIVSRTDLSIRRYIIIRLLLAACTVITAALLLTVGVR